MQVPYTSYIFASPWAFLLLLILPISFFIYKKYLSNRKLTYTVSTINNVKKTNQDWKVKWRPYLKYLISIAYILMVIALARPQDTASSTTIDTEGIDIVLTMDVSPSMEIYDLQPSRLEASKEVAINFVKSRPTDRIGLVIFAEESFTQCPLTIDHNVLINQIDNLHSNLLGASTTIGQGLASAVNNLRNINSKSKVIILLTDGVDEGGSISPETALEIAQLYNIRVYTIGVGSNNPVYLPVTDNLGNVIGQQKVPVTIDEEVLKKIAKGTGGQYFRATDNVSLQKIYNEIDQLEKTKSFSNAITQYEELYKPFLLLALLFLILHSILKYTIFRSIT